MLATTTAPRPLGLHPIRALAAVVSAVLVVALLPASAEAAPPKRRTKVRADFTATSVVVGTAYRGAVDPSVAKWWQTWTNYADN